jgi:hypothetical protein
METSGPWPLDQILTNPCDSFVQVRDFINHQEDIHNIEIISNLTVIFEPGMLQFILNQVERVLTFHHPTSNEVYRNSEAQTEKYFTKNPQFSTILG